MGVCGSGDSVVDNSGDPGLAGRPSGGLSAEDKLVSEGPLVVDRDVRTASPSRVGEASSMLLRAWVSLLRRTKPLRARANLNGQQGEDQAPSHQAAPARPHSRGSPAKTISSTLSVGPYMPRGRSHIPRPMGGRIGTRE